MENLSVKNIEVKYQGTIIGVSNVSLQLSDSQVVGILGANGVGKSTVLKAISGLLSAEDGKVTRGSILLDDVRIDNNNPEEIASKGIIQVIEGRRLFTHLTVENNLVAGAYMLKGSEARKRLEMVYNVFPILKLIRHRVSGYISGGEQQMLVTGRALMAKPNILMLDEPSLGLAPAIVRDTYEKLSEIKEQEQISIIISEQNAVATLKISDYVYVLDCGMVVLDGSSEKMKENKDIQEFYLGIGEKGTRKSYSEVKHYRRRKRWM